MCNGNESRLTDCPRNQDNGCGEDAGVTCSKCSEARGYIGVIEFIYTPSTNRSGHVLSKTCFGLCCGITQI